MPSGHGSCLVLSISTSLQSTHGAFCIVYHLWVFWQPPASQGCTHSRCSVPVPVDCGVQGGSGDCHCKKPRQWLPRDQCLLSEGSKAW